MKKAWFIFLYLLMPSLLLAQLNQKNPYPEVGKKCPDFNWTNVAHYYKDKISSADLIGKWTILDFWGKNCSACIKNFPETNNLKNLYGDKLQIILVGYQDKDNEVAHIYENYRKKLNLNLPIAYDSVQFLDFVYHGFIPLLIWINEKGIVEALTSSNALTIENVNKFLAGDNFFFVNQDSNSIALREQNQKSQVLDTSFSARLKKISDKDIVEGSYLSKWQPQYEKAFRPDILKCFQLYHNRIVQYAASVARLYFLAYLGKPDVSFDDSLFYETYYTHPMLEIKDSSRFFPNYATGENLYDYNLLIQPFKRNIPYVMQRMQQDMMNYFGFKATIETRKVLVWKLVASERGKNQLKTKGGKASLHDVRYGLQIKNMSTYDLVSIIRTYNQDGINILDESQIKGNIDISLSCMMTDLNDIKNALKRNGLDLILDEKEMKVLVIRDDASSNM